MITILSSILRGVWAIEPSYAQSYRPLILAVLQGDAGKLENVAREFFHAGQQDANGINKSQLPFAVSMSDYMIGKDGYGRVNISQAPKNSVAVIPVTGAITKYDYCGSPGTRTYMNWLRQIDTNPNILGTLLQVDTGGGEAYGTQDLSEYVKSVNKPVVSFINNAAASAGYWIASGAKEVYTSFNSDLVGSIGTFFTLFDDAGYYEKEGIKIHEIYATKSTEKNAEFKEALGGNYKPILDRLINPLNESFHKSVKMNRRGKAVSPEVFTGKTYMAAEAQEKGLIDGITSFNYAVERVIKLAKS